MTDDTQSAVLAKAKAIVKQFYPEMPDNYEGRRVKIAITALRQTTQSDEEGPCPKCNAAGDDCGEHTPSWKELAAYWKAEAERLRQPTQSNLHKTQSASNAIPAVDEAATILELREELADALWRIDSLETAMQYPDD